MIPKQISECPLRRCILVGGNLKECVISQAPQGFHPAQTPANQNMDPFSACTLAASTIALVAFLGLFLSTATAVAGTGFDSFGGFKGLRGKRTGWFHVEQIEGRWYFVTPEGYGFFSLGATHAVECIRLDELNLFETKYGKSEERLSEFF
jgi:hypothetical protein